MNYNIEKVNYEINNFCVGSTNIIGANIIVHKNNNLEKTTHQIINYIGKGSVGQVYLIKSIENLELNIIKISHIDCVDDLEDEIKLMEFYFKKYKIIHNSYPISYGFFRNLKGLGVIFPYLGFYNLERIKQISYSIDFNNNIKIIKQLINQLSNLTNIVHCDLKPSNVVIDITNDTVKVSIVDFGLTRTYFCKNVTSTNYIISPESLLTTCYFADCKNNDYTINLRKHDYIGLFCIIVNLFTECNFWKLISSYLVDLGFPLDFLYEQSASVIFVYNWFKLTCENKNDIQNDSLVKLLDKIELKNKIIVNKKFLPWDDFFKNYIGKNINLQCFNVNKLDEFKNFIKKLIMFDYKLRPEYCDLLLDPFLLP